jgi:hypothetical protein
MEGESLETLRQLQMALVEGLLTLEEHAEAKRKLLQSRRGREGRLNNVGARCESVKGGLAKNVENGYIRVLECPSRSMSK